MGRNKKQDNRQVWNALIMVFQFGINMLVPIFACTLVGVYIGNKTEINWISVPMFFVGALAGFNNIYRMARKMISDSERKTKK